MGTTAAATRRRRSSSPLDDRQQLSAVMENPLQRGSRDELLRDVDAFCQQHGLTGFVDDFRKGALVAQNPGRAADELADLGDDEREVLRREVSHRWSQPWTLYWLCVMCSLAAAVQGMDETVNNGAQALYLEALDIAGPNVRRFSQQTQDNLTGLIVGAPYLCCAVVACWLNEPLNRLLGRRGTIFVSCFVAAVASVWEGLANSWVKLFLARFVLGFGIGPKSSTVPVYAAECSPAPIRGALMWTAFGIMLGNIMGVAFGPSTGLSKDLGWRLMLGITVVLSLFVCTQVYYCPESPRWYIQHGQVAKAFRSLQRLRFTNLQAARDTYYTYIGVELEREVNRGKKFLTQFLELFTVPRNRRATLASWIVMFGQQFCGVNIIAYYSTTIFVESNYSTNAALLASMGTGILNWIFAIPALFTIDRWGRRTLLLFTFPFLALTLLWTGMSFFIPDTPDPRARVAMMTTGMYLFEVFYSPGEGPVPFTYSAEAFPVHVRDMGMSWATATTWCFNFIISFTWPSLRRSFTIQGAFRWCAAWGVLLWILILLLVPETKALTLEELDQVFGVSTRKHMTYQIRSSIWHLRTWILRQRLEPLPPLYRGAEKLGES